MVGTAEIQTGGVLADRYRIRDRLGEGGMATVFLAEDCVLGRDVAIKRLHTAGSEVDERRFRREARVGASLMHPNLVTIFDTLSGPDGLLIVMEYVRGRPLSDLIGPDGMDPRWLLEILRPVASALDYSHHHGVVHRDVKPANVLIAEDRRVKLVDLGTATAGHVTQITAEHEVVGTLAYIAPERLAGESVGEPAADVYSLAVLAFEALTGQRPYRGETPAALLDEIHQRHLGWRARRGRGGGGDPGFGEFRHGLPPRLAEVMERGMDPDPDRRQASAGLLVRQFEAALPVQRGPAPALAGVTEPLTPPTEHRAAPDDEAAGPPPALPAAKRTGPRWPVPALVGICALLGIGAWLIFSGGGGGGDRTTADGKRPAASGEAHASSAGSPPATPPATTTTPAPPATGTVPSGDGAQLNAQGYSLIQQGRYDEAVPVLQKAVASFPAGTADINYAYALYNLGHALRLAGQPQEAIPILERRLQIPNQTETVQRELDAARAAAGH